MRSHYTCLKIPKLNSFKGDTAYFVFFQFFFFSEMERNLSRYSVRDIEEAIGDIRRIQALIPHSQGRVSLLAEELSPFVDRLRQELQENLFSRVVSPSQEAVATSAASDAESAMATQGDTVMFPITINFAAEVASAPPIKVVANSSQEVLFLAIHSILKSLGFYCIVEVPSNIPGFAPAIRGNLSSVCLSVCLFSISKLLSFVFCFSCCRAS